MKLNFRLLGVPEISIDDSLVSESIAAKGQALLFYLAMTERRQTRSLLAALLWGDVAESAARTSLRKTLVNLRQAVGDFLEIDRQGVGFLSGDSYWIDVAEFEAGVGEPSSSSSSSSGAPVDIQRLEAALALYQGDFLTGFYVRNAPEFESWLTVEQARLRELATQGLSTLVLHYSQQGQFEQAIVFGRRLLQLEPWREETQRDLMQLLAQTGQRSAALAQYEICRQVLDDELGVEPDIETTALYERIRRGEFKREREAQLPTSGGATPVSVSAPSSPLIHNLPAQPTPFVGRERELSDIVRRLTDPDCRLLTLVGPGGIGKTRLALRVAQDILARDGVETLFADGIFFVSLAAVSSTAGAIAEIAKVTRLTFFNNVSPERQLLDHLRERATFLVLDNFEHLLESIDLIVDILAVAPQVKLLVTAREPLNLQAEWFHPVEGMTYPAVGDEPGGVEAFDAVRLFVQSARRAQVRFDLASALPHVVRICRLVEGMPLGIELAAAWLRILSPEKIAAELERSLDILSSRLQNLPARHRNIRAVFEHSWQHLQPVEQATLSELAVFQGGFLQDAAEQVADTTFLTLTTFVEKSFLRMRADGRYQNHQLLRQFMAEKLATNEQTETITREKHSAFYLEFLKTRTAMLAGEDQPRVLNEILAEIENIRAAWYWAVDHGYLAAIQQVTETLFNFYQLSSRLQEGAELFDYATRRLRAGLQGAEHPAFNKIQAKLLIHQGAFCYLLGEYDAANRVLEEGLTITRSSGQQRDTAFALLVLGPIAGWQGQRSLAQQYLRESLTIYRAVDDRDGMADALHELGDVEGRFGDYATGKQLAQESLAISRSIGRPDWIAHALRTLGWNAVSLGEYELAEACYQESLTIFEGLGSLRGQASALEHLGWVAFCMGGPKLAEAQRYEEAGLVLARKTGSRIQITSILGYLALATNELGDFSKALQYAQEGLTIARILNSPLNVACHLVCQGEAALGLGDLAAGRTHLLEALRITYEVQLLPQLLTASFYFARLLLAESTPQDPPAVIAAGRAGQLQALQLLHLVAGHPAAWHGFKARAQPHLAALQKTLPPDLVSQVAAQDQNRLLLEIVEAILQ